MSEQYYDVLYVLLMGITTHLSDSIPVPIPLPLPQQVTLSAMLT